MIVIITHRDQSKAHVNLKKDECPQFQNLPFFEEITKLTFPNDFTPETLEDCFCNLPNLETIEGLNLSKIVCMDRVFNNSPKYERPLHYWHYATPKEKRKKTFTEEEKQALYRYAAKIHKKIKKKLK